MKTRGATRVRFGFVSAGLVLALAALSFHPRRALAQESPTAHPGRILFLPEQVTWTPATALPHGAEMAVLEGDPNKPGFFTMRLRMPDGYRVPAHSHSQRERIVVLKGVLNLGMGRKFDAAKTDALKPGTYSSTPPEMKHFAWVKGETILQLSSIGPWTVTYVDPKEDPRLARQDSGHLAAAARPAANP